MFSCDDQIFQIDRSCKNPILIYHIKCLDKEAKEDVQKLLSYEEDQIGSCMTNNYIVVRNDVTIREAMSTLVKQAGEHDNIQTLYVIDENGIFAGAIDLKDLIIAREQDNLQDIKAVLILMYMNMKKYRGDVSAVDANVIHHDRGKR